MVRAGRRHPSGAARWVGSAALAVFALGTVPAIAAAAPDQANQVLQQNQRNAERAGSENQPPAGGVVVAPSQRAELPPAGGPMFLLKSVTFEPQSAFLTEAELDAITAKYIGHMVDFRQISALVRDVNDLYAKKGVVTAGAVLPPQNLKSGELKVQLVEGREGKVAIVGAHITKDDVFLKAVRLTRDGDIVDVPTASQDIARFNKTHHAQLSLLLKPGATFGLTDLTLGVREPPPNIVQLSVDDYGAASTGAIEGTALYQHYGCHRLEHQGDRRTHAAAQYHRQLQGGDRDADAGALFGRGSECHRACDAVLWDLAIVLRRHAAGRHIDHQGRDRRGGELCQR